MHIFTPIARLHTRLTQYSTTTRLILNFISYKKDARKTGIFFVTFLCREVSGLTKVYKSAIIIKYKSRIFLSDWETIKQKHKIGGKGYDRA